MTNPNWKDAPEWAQWLAMDRAQTWFWYETKPIPGPETFRNTCRYILARGCGGDEKGRNWADTLEPRPVKATAHPHAALMALYAQDAAETDEPHLRWECQAGVRWTTMKRTPQWLTDCIYRRKQKMRSLNGHEYPEPLSEAPPAGAAFFIPRPQHEHYITHSLWIGNEFDRRCLSRGLVHLIEGAAVQHATAIILAGGGEV